MLRKLAKCSVLAAAIFAADPAVALDAITSRDLFLDKLEGRDLTIRLYGLSLTVTPDGRINGRAVGRPITGDWSWQDGYFCREMMWGQRPIEYNCQLVEARENTMRFTTDRGDGYYADFRLR